MLLSEFVSGSAFGAALLGAGVYSPSVIQSQMTFSSNTMITVMMGASASSAIVFEATDRLGWIATQKRKPSSLGLFDYDGNVIGGCMVGIGMALTKACPGTVLLQICMGMPRAIVVALGGVFGTFTFIQLSPAMQTARIRADERESSSLDNTKPSGRRFKATHMAEMMGMNPIYLLTGWIFMCLTIIGVASSKDSAVDRVPQAGLVTPKYGGLLIGAAQLCSVLLLKHAIGVSTAYQDLAAWLKYRVSRTETPTETPRPILTPSLVFATGMLCSGAVLGQILRRTGPLEAFGPKEMDRAASGTLSFVGGACMLFGARLAKGCTSGHGISGLAAFGVSSLVSTAAMFGAGIATTAAIGSIDMLL